MKTFSNYFLNWRSFFPLCWIFFEYKIFRHNRLHQLHQILKTSSIPFFGSNFMFAWGEDRVRMLLTWSAIDWSAAEISTYCHLKCSANWYASSASTSLFQSRSYFVPIKMTDGGIFFSWWIKCARSTIHWNESKFDISKSNRTISFDFTAFNQLFWKCSVRNVRLYVTKRIIYIKKSGMNDLGFILVAIWTVKYTICSF